MADLLGELLDNLGGVVRDELVSLPFQRRYELFVDAVEQLCKVHDVRLAPSHNAGGFIAYDGARANHSVDELLANGASAELGRMTGAGYVSKDGEA